MLVPSDYTLKGQDVVSSWKVIVKSFNETIRCAIHEYCGYALKFATDHLESGRRSFSCIEILLIQCKI